MFIKSRHCIIIIEWFTENVETPGNARDSLYLDAEQTTSQECPALMVYLIDSFTYGSDWDPSVERLTKVGLLKCYNQLVKSLPETLQQNISLQIIPLSTILETMEKGFNMQTLQSICFSVFSMCRWNLAHSILGRHLTGFGPAAAAEIFLRKKEVHYLFHISYLQITCNVLNAQLYRAQVTSVFDVFYRLIKLEVSNCMVLRLFWPPPKTRRPY